MCCGEELKMAKIGDFGEVQRDAVSSEVICTFGEFCVDALPETTICAFGEACDQSETGGAVGSFGELFEAEAPFLALDGEIGVFGEPARLHGQGIPKQKICAFGEECPETGDAKM